MPSTKTLPTKKASVSKQAARPVSMAAEKHTYLKQSDVSGASPEEAFRIQQAIPDHYAGKATAPLYMAKALSVNPMVDSSDYRQERECFGLIEGVRR